MRFPVFLLVVAALLAGLSSCKKGGCNGFLLQSYNDSLATNTFTIANGKPTKLAEYNGSYTTYHYNSNSFLDTIANFDVTGLKLSYQVYTYNGKQLASQSVYSSANNASGILSAVSQDLYTYSGSNISQDNETIYGVTDTDKYTISYTYDNNSNVITEEKDQTYQPAHDVRLVYKRNYTYDTNHTPWGILTKYMGNFSTNNILSIIDSQNPAADMTYSYQYNSGGYPTTSSETSAGGGYTKTVQYNYCQ